MNINATVASITGKMVVIAYERNSSAFPRVVETKTPFAFKNWDVEEWADTVEIRCAYKGQKWGLEKKHD